MLPRSEPSESLICRRGVEDKQDAIELNFWDWKRMGNGIVMLPLARHWHADLPTAFFRKGQTRKGHCARIWAAWF